MKESELGSELSRALRVRSWSVFKLHNTAFQRGLPDYVMWHKESDVILFELKVAPDAEAAERALTPGQQSVLESLQKTMLGALLVYADATHAGFRLDRKDGQRTSWNYHPPEGVAHSHGAMVDELSKRLEELLTKKQVQL